MILMMSMTSSWETLLARGPAQLPYRVHYHLRLFLVDELARARDGVRGEVREPVAEQLALLVGNLRWVLDPPEQQPDRTGELVQVIGQRLGFVDFAIRWNASMEPERSTACPAV